MSTTLTPTARPGRLAGRRAASTEVAAPAAGHPQAVRPGDHRAGDQGQLHQAQPLHPHPQPGDVRGRGRVGAHHDPVPPRPRLLDRVGERVRRTGQPLAVVHGAVRQLRRGDGRGPRQGAGGDAAQDAAPRPSPTSASPTAPSSRSRRRRSTSATSASSPPVRSIPGDGDVVEGIATVDESAITGESAPVIRESGGDRSAVTGGTRVLSDEIVVQDHLEAGRDVPRPDDRPRRGRQPPEDAERDRADDPPVGPDDHLPAGGRHAAAVRHLLRCRAVDHRARRPAGVPHPDDHRRPALGDRHRRHGSPRAAQRARP